MSQRLGVEHHMFIQTLAARRIVSEQEAEELIVKCYQIAEKSTHGVELKDHITKINAQLQSLFLEIRKGACEISGAKYYAFVNSKEDEASKLCTNYSAQDFSYFRKILEKVVLSEEEGSLRSSDCLILCNNLPDQKKMTYAHAKELLSGWCNEKWLIEDRSNNTFLLGPRAIIELGQYITSAYNEHVANCNLCMSLCIYGQRCEECNTKFHYHCVQRLINHSRDTGEVRCPHCKSEWS